MSREWKPGDVARIHYGEFADIAVRLDPRDWAVSAGTVRDQSVDIAYPLVVIDPEADEDVARLEEAIASHDEWAVPRNGPRRKRMQNALRSLVTPPKPDEPTGLGAVVEDSEGHQWARNADGTWCARSVHHANYDSIRAVKVLSDGVTP